MSEARSISNMSASNLLHSITNPAPSANADVVPSHKQRATGSTHFGDGDWDEERPEDIQDATWGEVWQVCCVHSATEWGYIFIGACFALFFLYFFLISIELLGSAAKVLTGCSAGGLFGSESNAIAGFVIGMLVTVLIQSSSTTTSIIVSLVGAQAISVQYGIYMVMGANVGTSVTNTIVSMGQMADGPQLERAFAGATVHDCFNLLTVLVLLPVEVITHYLYHLVTAITPDELGYREDNSGGGIKAIVAPISDRIIKANSKVIEEIAIGVVDSCDAYYPVFCVDGIEDYKHCAAKCEEGQEKGVDCGRVGSVTCSKDFGCPAFFQDGATQSEDTLSGGVCLFLSIVLLIVCLMGLVNVLNRGLQGLSTRVIYKATNVNGLLAMLIGCGITVAVQSSSITTSVLTPLVGVGVIQLEQMFPLTLGANIGTTITGLLASMVSDSVDALQVALAHLFFNVSGIIIWYPIPPMRRVPLRMARALGRATRRSKLVPPIYIAVVFFLLPIVLLLISSCFEKKSIGFTVLGSFIVIFFLLAAIRFGVWWKYQDGQTKCLAMLDKRTDMSECKKTLPEDMKSLKKNMELVKSKVLEICEHTGVPAEFDEAEEPAELKQLDNDEGEEGTDESDGPAKPDDVDGHNVKESIMSA